MDKKHTPSYGNINSIEEKGKRRSQVVMKFYCSECNNNIFKEHHSYTGCDHMYCHCFVVSHTNYKCIKCNKIY
jgi:hypothetical protein